MNKKGFLLGEETLKIIIAVIAISFLIYLLFSLYYANKGSKELEQAKASLEYLIKEINAGSSEVEIYSPKGWIIVSWPDEGYLPKACSGVGWDNCLCICQSPRAAVKTSAVACETKGICLDNDYAVKGRVWNDIEIEKPPLILSINHENKIIQKAG